MFILGLSLELSKFANAFLLSAPWSQTITFMKHRNHFYNNILSSAVMLWTFNFNFLLILFLTPVLILLTLSHDWILANAGTANPGFFIINL